MIGAHLDSVREGPGINDNGSGVAVTLALAERLRGQKGLRFGFWGAEELGLYGSRRYVESLTPKERERIKGYVNLDMVGSPNPVRYVYGAGRVRDALEAALRKRKLRFEPITIGASSDHAPFAGAGISAAGLYSGSEERKTATQARAFGGRSGRPLDPCYHQRCDVLERVDRDVMTELGEAAGDALRGARASLAAPMQLPPARTPARRRLVVLAVLAVLALIVGIAVGAGSGDDEASRAPAPEPATRDTPERPRAEAVGAAEKLSLRRQVGQLIVMRFNGPGPPAYVPQALRGGRAAGVILFKDNVESRPALKRLVAKLQRGARGSALVATDQEGGEIRNLTWARPVEGQAAVATARARPRRRPRRRARPPRRGGQRQPRAGRATSRRAPAR